MHYTKTHDKMNVIDFTEINHWKNIQVKWEGGVTCLDSK